MDIHLMDACMSYQTLTSFTMAKKLFYISEYDNKSSLILNFNAK